jgi:hypothetical protein
MSKFPLGQIVATPGALEALKESGQTPAHFLDRHAAKDWGEVCAEDKALNDQALVDGLYHAQGDETLDHNGSRP